MGRGNEICRRYKVSAGSNDVQRLIAVQYNIPAYVQKCNLKHYPVRLIWLWSLYHCYYFKVLPVMTTLPGSD